MQAIAAMAAFFFVLSDSGWSYGEVLAPADPVYLQATTACLIAIVVMQIANVFLCRSPSLSIFTLGLLSNRFIVSGIVVEIVIILLIVYSDLGNALFGTAPVTAEVWLFATPFAIAMLVLEEGRKWLVRHHTSQP